MNVAAVMAERRSADGWTSRRRRLNVGAVTAERHGGDGSDLSLNCSLRLLVDSAKQREREEKVKMAREQQEQERKRKLQVSNRSNIRTVK